MCKEESTIWLKAECKLSTLIISLPPNSFGVLFLLFPDHSPILPKKPNPYGTQRRHPLTWLPYHHLVPDCHSGVKNALPITWKRFSIWTRYTIGHWKIWRRRENCCESHLFSATFWMNMKCDVCIPWFMTYSDVSKQKRLILSSNEDLNLSLKGLLGKQTGLSRKSVHRNFLWRTSWRTVFGKMRLFKT